MQNNDNNLGAPAFAAVEVESSFYQTGNQNTNTTTNNNSPATASTTTNMNNNNNTSRINLNNANTNADEVRLIKVNSQQQYQEFKYCSNSIRFDSNLI